MTIFLRFLVICGSLCLSTYGHTCIHNKMSHNITVIETGTPKNLQTSDGRNLQQTYESIRIYADYTRTRLLFILLKENRP